MTYEIYRYIFYGGAILATIMFVVSLILFIVLKIPAVIGDLSGATARKAIEDIRNQNEHTGEKKHGTTPVNKARGTLTDKISKSGNLIRNPSANLGTAFNTEKISTQKLQVEETAGETPVLETGNETTVLSTAGETTLLDNMEAGNETTVLSPDMMTGYEPAPIFVIEYEITYIHTEEVIV